LDTREMIERRVHGKAAGGAHYLMRIVPYRGSDDAIDGVLITFIDVTQVVEGEQHQALLVAELNHRVRNMLGVVIGLVAKSAAREPEARAFSDRLLERLHALARTYALISRDNWVPLHLRELVEAELIPFADAEDGRRISIEGGPVLLAPKTALAFGMALHELATNATKHGALGSPAGRVEVSWSMDGEKVGRRLLALRWRETDGPAVVDSGRSGFGTELLRRLISYELDGEARIEFAPEGVRAELTAPIDGELVRLPEGPMVARDGDGSHG
jgi:two-component system, chemotaxis family, CheB/CheR fusion protein